MVKTSNVYTKNVNHNCVMFIEQKKVFTALHLGLSLSLLSRWKKLLSTGVPLLSDMRKKATHDGLLGQLARLRTKFFDLFSRCMTRECQ